MLLLQVLELCIFQGPLLVLLSKGWTHRALMVRSRILLLLLLVLVEILVARNVSSGVLRVGPGNLTNLRGAAPYANATANPCSHLGASRV